MTKEKSLWDTIKVLRAQLAEARAEAKRLCTLIETLNGAAGLLRIDLEQATETLRLNRGTIDAFRASKITDVPFLKNEIERLRTLLRETRRFTPPDQAQSPGFAEYTISGRIDAALEK